MFTLPDNNRITLRIVAFYALFAGLWIFFSDALLAFLVADKAALTRLSILKGWLFVVVTAALLYALIRSHVKALLNHDQQILEAVQGISTATGEEFFASLVRHLAGTLKVDYALAGEVIEGDPPTMRTIAVFGKGQPMENFEYSLAGTPCAEVLKNGGRGCFHPSGVTSKFPGDNLLTKMGVEGYIGTPLCDSSGQALGLMAVLNCRPMEEKGLAESLFQLFAVRAAAELERRRAEKDLRESEERYRHLFETNPHPMWVYDTETLSFLMVNSAAIRHYGYSREEFLAMTIREIRPKEDVPVLLTHLSLTKTDFDKAGIWRHCKKDGAVIDVEITSHTVRFEGKSARLILAHDVTQQLRAERALQSQFSQLTTIFDSINAIVYVADLATYEVLFLNRFGTSVFGTDWQGKPCHEIFQPGEEGPCPFCTNDQLVADGQPCPPHAWEYLSPVTGKWYQCIDRAIPWTDNRLVKLEIAFDITDRKEMERLKDELVSSVSHEMRTPLTAMLGYTEFMLENEVPSEQQKEFLQTIYHETERLNELISNFLDLQRVKMRPQPLELDRLSAEEILGKTFGLFGAAPYKHRFALECPPGLPPVIGNAEQLHQVLVNLMSNAVKYSPDGTLITLGAHRDGEDVVIWVRDEGIGIPPEMQERIFERFYRIDNSDRRLVGGAGLGLALVREIVDAHHGKVWVESAVGRGSTFCVRLPAMAREE